MKYFFDNNISPKYAKMLAALDVDATALRDEFDASIKDVDLFPKLHGRNLVFVSGDIRIRTRLAEAQALHSCGVTALFFDRFWGKMTFWQQASWLVAKWPKVNGFASGVTLGTCAMIRQNGTSDVFQL